MEEYNNKTIINDDPFFLLFHVVPMKLTYGFLNFPNNNFLPTAYYLRFIKITNNSEIYFTVNNVLLTKQICCFHRP
ncbi:hypothetical protein P8452_14997 [Trifolium repens]|nr:hypothetical protein P8452_14997 [Trifolium repens]